MANFADYTRNEETEVNSWVRFGLRLGVSAALHPFEYSKTLIQIGYEPIAAKPGKSMIGRPIMALPNIFQYAGHIRTVDGFYGCYRGLAPKLAGSVLSMVVSERVAEKLGLAHQQDKDESELTEEENYVQFKYNLKRDIVLTVSGIVVAHPFHVISLRMMAQFVGRESLYNSILGSIAEIWKTEGLLGFFSGLIPKLLCDVACLVLSSSTVFVVNKYFIKDKMARQYNAGFIQFVYSSLLYPLQVVSTCSAISGSRLMAGQPPIMPSYRNWVDCWNDLQGRRELKRGSSLFWRSQITDSRIIATSAFAPLPKLSRYQ
ncbi:mitochondrial carrier homolog 2 [Drosophila hydei]|uniref:Mitochondrial carrier homolog 2 n=1 Tax=Drosophila hydei TaxID=7224 RepID=A0A6J2SQX2_DROHY|nr:mitochondrial carrier homolog 2 [Drosophila hydei]XP_030079486.1 mitochondrial carrier homolog 2 [Drosophila hydei]